MCAAALAQTPQGAGPYISPEGIVFPLQNPPSGVSSASVKNTGNTGQRVFWYWIVVQGEFGAATPSGPFALYQAANLFGEPNGAQLNWQPVAGALSYDVLRTAEGTSPSGNCNCAVATGVTATTLIDDSESLGAYTVTTANARATQIRLSNLVTGFDASCLATTQGDVTQCLGGGGSGSPGGPENAVQYNQPEGTFAGSGGLTYNGQNLIDNNTDGTGAAFFNTDYEDDIGGATIYSTSISTVLTGSNTGGDNVIGASISAESSPTPYAPAPNNVYGATFQVSDYSTTGPSGAMTGIEILPSIGVSANENTIGLNIEDQGGPTAIALYAYNLIANTVTNNNQNILNTAISVEAQFIDDNNYGNMDIGSYASATLGGSGVGGDLASGVAAEAINYGTSGLTNQITGITSNVVQSDDSGSIVSALVGVYISNYSFGQTEYSYGLKTEVPNYLVAPIIDSAAIFIADPTDGGVAPDAWAIEAPIGANLFATAEFDQPTPTVAAGDIGFGNSTVAASFCGALAAKCLKINDGGTPAYIPVYE
jgi:hypothetical protein